MDELAELNRQYEQKFGFIYIVCATGKSTEEMLSILRERLGNNADEELRNAAAEQAKITALRLNKLLEQKT
jgi:OHCU decarboxylase